MNSQDERTLLSCTKACDSSCKDLKPVIQKLKQFSKKQDQTIIASLLGTFDTLTKENMDNPSPGVLLEKARAIKTASEFIKEKTCGDNAVWAETSAAQMCYQELATVLNIQEKCHYRLLNIIR